MAINSSVLDEYKEVMGDDWGEFVADLIDTFLSNGPRLITDMRQAYSDNDLEVLERSAHSLKSNGKTFGATQLADVAFELEQMAGMGELQDPEDKINFADSLFQIVKSELEELRGTL
ncbi:MAG: Hpt domain-containing protein [Chloroflexi bacterium]|nr:Hpt domain-containing protein [Chloroflexota bacterium]